LSTLKELTAEVHAEAENQPFIKSIFAGNVNKDKYTSYVYQLMNLYSLLETYGDDHFIFHGMEDLKRKKAAEMDWVELVGDSKWDHILNPSTVNYLNYLSTIKNDPKKLLAHIYVRHMGDLFGGQMLAKLLPGSNNMYKFQDISKLIGQVRSKIDVSLADEAIVAFRHNIAMVKEYND